MISNFQFIDENVDKSRAILTEKLAFVKAVLVIDLPDEMQDKALGAAELYGVYDGDGVRLALTSSRSLAFVLARQNGLEPVDAH